MGVMCGPSLLRRAPRHAVNQPQRFPCPLGPAAPADVRPRPCRLTPRRARICCACRNVPRPLAPVSSRGRAEIYPEAFAEAEAAGAPAPLVRFADVGCGFGGLTIRLAETFPDKLVVGMELRDKVTGTCIRACVGQGVERAGGDWVGREGEQARGLRAGTTFKQERAQSDRCYGAACAGAGSPRLACGPPGGPRLVRGGAGRS